MVDHCPPLLKCRTAHLTHRSWLEYCSVTAVTLSLILIYRGCVQTLVSTVILNYCIGLELHAPTLICDPNKC